MVPLDVGVILPVTVSLFYSNGESNLLSAGRYSKLVGEVCKEILRIEGD